MKKINFITTLSPERQYAIARWYKVTFFVSVCCVGATIYFFSEPVLMYRALQKEVAALKTKTTSYDEKYKQKDALQKDHDVVRAHAHKIERYLGKPHNPHDVIKAIVTACSDGVHIESVRCNKKQCELVILCPTTEQATVFTQRLSATKLLNGIKLISLQRDGMNKQFRAVVKGMMVQRK
jgi:hypothetical protein